jgi:hypothetical protein
MFSLPVPFTGGRWRVWFQWPIEVCRDDESIDVELDWSSEGLVDFVESQRARAVSWAFRYGYLGRV